MAYCDKDTPAVFPDITYGFYKVFAQINNVPYREIPLGEDFTINKEDYYDAKGTIFIANPNAPTGMFIPVSKIEELLSSNKDRVVVIDEAYVDFGGESAIELVDKYDNLVVTQTFSKSRSLAGARLGFAIASAALIADMNTIKYSTNPYNVNRMTMIAGVKAIEEDDYFKNCIENIKQNREYTKSALESIGFEVLDSRTNFLFVRSDRISGEELYTRLKAAGILVRHFSAERIKEFNRITIGTREDMEKLIETVKEILGVDR
jgi:histidinol-phosphate aminotransferase